jgi:hypothetical protein
MARSPLSEEHFTIRMPASVKQDLIELAKENNRSMAAQMIWLIRQEAAKMRAASKKQQQQ